MIEVAKFYQNIIQNCVEKILLLSKNGEIEFMNQSAADFFQWSFSEENKRNILEYCYQTKGKMRAYLKELTNSRFEEFKEIKTTIARIGMKKSVVNMKGIYDSKRKVILLTLQLEEQIDEMKEMLSFHKEYSVIGQNNQFQITEWNESAEQYFGYKKDEVLGKSMKLLVPHNRDEEYYIITKLLKNNGSLKNYETFRCHKNQTLLPVTVFSAPVRNKSGDVIGYITIYKKRNYELNMDDTKILEEHISEQISEKIPEHNEKNTSKMDRIHSTWENSFLPHFSVETLAQVESKENNRIDETKVFFGKTVLGIDNSPIFQNVLEYILEENGCKYIQAYSGTLGLFILEQEKVDLILVDLKLCDMDSNEFAEKIKSNKEYKKIPIIIVTEYPHVYDSYLNTSWNIKKIILKPIRLKEFCETIRKYIK